uniref:Uncharacterized protein n=1 Tax=Escherichia phage BME3 TaxID=3119681 RepID=A0AAU6NV31_9CAUD
MVKRLEWDACTAHACHCDIVEDPNGEMVYYEDYEALHNAVIALLDDISSRYPGQQFTCPHIQLLAELTEYPSVS